MNINPIKPLPEEEVPKSDTTENQEENGSSIIDFDENEIVDADADIASALAALEKIDIPDDEPEDTETFSEDVKVAEKASDEEISFEISSETDKEKQADSEPVSVSEEILNEVKKETEKHRNDLTGARKKIKKLQLNIKKIKKANSQYKNQIEKLSESLETVKGKWIRVNADYQNYQKRSRSKMIEFVKVEEMGLIRKFLPVFENFKRALNHTDNNENFREGINLIYKQIEELFASWKVVEIPALNEMFDPFIHEAIDRMTRSDVENNRIIEVFETGYFFKDKVLRPAKVIVAYNKTEEPDKVDEITGSDGPGTDVEGGLEQEDKDNTDSGEEKKKLNGKKLESEK